MVHQIIVLNSHSLQASARTNACGELYPHLLVYSECVQAHSLTHNTVGVYTHTHTHMHTHQVWITARRSQQRSRYCQMVHAMCVWLQLWCFDLWCCLACESSCVFVYAYMCGRLVLLWFIQCVFVCVCVFSFYCLFFVFFFNVCSLQIAPQTAGLGSCLPPATALLKIGEREREREKWKIHEIRFKIIRLQ